jgi:hypothetical protein
MPKTASFHEDFGREDEVKGSSDRSFGLLFAAFSGLAGGFRLWHGKPFAWTWLVAAAVLLAISLSRPGLLGPFNRAWMKLGLLLFRVVSPVVTALLFYICMVPIGLIMRVAGREDPLRRRFDQRAPSYWITRDPKNSSAIDMKNQF